MIRTACTDMRYERGILLKSPLRVVCQSLYKSNIRYKDVIQNKTLEYLVIRPVPFFAEQSCYMILDVLNNNIPRLYCVCILSF